MVQCDHCEAKGIIRRPKTGRPICKDCFFKFFEDEIHQTIIDSKLFRPGDRVAIAASGGKGKSLEPQTVYTFLDSTVLAYIIKLLNERHSYGLELILLSVDEGITGYRDDSLATVQRNKVQYGLPLKIVSYKELYNGWTMDKVVERIGRKNNCTFCGVFRRQALDRGAALLEVDQILTGHNADDMAETVLMNLLRGDIARLRRCTDITTGTLPPSQNTCSSPPPSPHEDGGEEMAKVVRSKPFKHSFEKEIVMYAYFKRLDYFSTECIYAPNAYRGFARTFLKDLEAIKPKAILDIIKSGEAFEIKTELKRKEQRTCERCGYISSNLLCKACTLLESLDTTTTVT